MSCRILTIAWLNCAYDACVSDSCLCLHLGYLSLTFSFSVFITHTLSLSPTLSPAVSLSLSLHLPLFLSLSCACSLPCSLPCSRARALSLSPLPPFLVYPVYRVFPLKETLETFVAGTVFAVATNLVLIGSTKVHFCSCSVYACACIYTFVSVNCAYVCVCVIVCVCVCIYV